MEGVVSTGKHAVQGDSGKKHDARRIHFFDGIKVSRMLGTATAAVTTSLISTHFLNTLSTVIVVFLTSIITGLSVELWSRTLHKTGQDAARMVARIPYDKILPKPVAGNINEKLENLIDEPDDDDDGFDTDEYRAIRDALLKDPAFRALGTASQNDDDDQASATDEPIIDEAIREINANGIGSSDLVGNDNDAVSVPIPKYSAWADEHSDASRDTTDDGNGTKPYVLGKKLFGLDTSTEQSPMWKIFRLVILFCIVSVFTVGGVWLSETFITKPDVTNVYRTTGLSRNDKQAIYDATQKQIDDRLSELETLKTRMDSLDSTINDLHERVQSLDGDNANNSGTNATGNNGTDTGNDKTNGNQGAGTDTNTSSSGPSGTNSGTGNTGETDGNANAGTNQGTTSQNNATKQDITTLNQQITDMQAEIQDLRKQLELMQQQSSTQSSSPSPSPSPTTIG